MDIARRTLLTLAAGAGLAPGLLAGRALAMPPATKSLAGSQVRRAFIHNLHTGESLNAVYWESGRYVPMRSPRRCA